MGTLLTSEGKWRLPGGGGHERGARQEAARSKGREGAELRKGLPPWVCFGEEEMRHSRALTGKSCAAMQVGRRGGVWSAPWGCWLSLVGSPQGKAQGQGPGSGLGRLIKGSWQRTGRLRERMQGRVLGGVKGQCVCGPEQKQWLRKSGSEKGFLSKISEESPL